MLRNYGYLSLVEHDHCDVLLEILRLTVLSARSRIDVSFFGSPFPLGISNTLGVTSKYVKP